MARCGGLGVPLGLLGRVGVRGVALSAGPVPWSRVLWGSRRLALGAVAVPSSSSGACAVALVVAGVVAGGEGVVVGCAAVFLAASSVGAARSPRVGVPSIPCVVSGGWWACAGVIRMASDSCFGGVCWGRAPPGVVRRPLGVGRRWSLRSGMPFLRVGPGARSCPFLALGWFPDPTLCRFRCPVPMGACLSLGALPCPLAGVSLSVPCPPLARALSLPGVVVVGWGGGADGPGGGLGGLEPLAEGSGRVKGAEALDGVAEEGLPCRLRHDGLWGCLVGVGGGAAADRLEGMHHVHPFSPSRSPGPLHPAA